MGSEVRVGGVAGWRAPSAAVDRGVAARGGAGGGAVAAVSALREDVRVRGRTGWESTVPRRTKSPGAGLRGRVG